MEQPSRILEYKCPCCNAGLVFGEDVQQLKCEYCDNTFDIDTVRAFNESRTDSEEFTWADAPKQTWSEEEQATLQAFLCPSCGGEILTDENTAATFCPYCDNPTIMPARLSGGLKPDAVLPFKTGKEDAKTAFSNLCKGKLVRRPLPLYKNRPFSPAAQGGSGFCGHSHGRLLQNGRHVYGIHRAL